MRPGEITATRLLHRFEVHQLDTHEIRIVKVELPFAVSAELRLFVAVRLPTVRLQRSLRFLDLRDPQRNVVHHPGQPQVDGG